MIIGSTEAEQDAVLQVARQMCVAARTAPKARGWDHIFTCIITGEELGRLADEMDRLALKLGMDIFTRDANNVRSSHAVVLIGVADLTRWLGGACAYCGYKDCEACAQQSGVCVYDPIDLGIALGSAVALAADMRVDNRIMYTVGKAALSLGYLGVGARLAMGIPLAVSGKSPFFDRDGK